MSTNETEPSKAEYDFLVIGSGAAGSIAAQVLAKSKKRVVMVERASLGGRLTNHASAPLRTFSNLARIFVQAKAASDLGIKSTALSYDYETMARSAHSAAMRLSAGLQPAAYRSLGIDMVKGDVHFVSENEVSVGRHRISAKKILIACGAHEYIPPIMGLKESGYVTPEKLLAAKTLPKSVAIIGGGSTAVEMAVILQSFGSEVTIIERKGQLMPKHDHHIGQILKPIYEKRGIRVVTDAHRSHIETKGNKKLITIEHTSDKQTEISTHEIVVASGLRPNLDLGLSNAGVLYDEGGVVVNQQLQTNVKHIWAAGDVVGEPRYVHVSAYQGRIAAHNMLHRVKTDYPSKAVPAVIFADPEVATVGKTEEQLKTKKVAYKVLSAKLTDVARSIVDNTNSGFVKILVNKRGRILGAHIVGPNAGEMIHELSLAMTAGVNIETVASSMHAYPSWSETIRVAASKF